MAWSGNLTIFYENEPRPELKCFMPSNGGGSSGSIRSIQVPVQERKRRLSMDQIELLERSFQEDIKLEPEKKMMLARELGLQPRQVAVWFQNRRARWKAKQLERVYGALKQEFEAISREKKMLQEEVLKLRAELHERATAASAKEGSITAQTDSISAEETVESTIVFHNTCNSNSNSNRINNGNLESGRNCQQTGECSYLLNVGDYESSLPTYWGVLTDYP